ncbi:hypothetical protein DXZ20_15380 [Leptolyngbyaceae cyanobacterium CCMR0081]|uniref:Uncharacterized protein n=1 Tax=Adonisia turfae CCMR0081 TaxID=2292702 RepID=A0A6M0RLA7_9CYAN|nr:hypothetical protein [Adonisia turfae CCMR0081]
MITLRKLSQLLNWRVLRLWLSLLVLGGAFWTIGQLMTLRILGRTYDTSRYVITGVQPEEDISKEAIRVIRVEICNEAGTSEARVIFNDLGDRKLQFDLTVPGEIEGAIAKEINIPQQAISKLVQYKVRDPCSM